MLTGVTRVRHHLIFRPFYRAIVVMLSLVMTSVVAQAQTAAPPQGWPAPPKIAASQWMLVDATTGQTLASSNSEAAIMPASLTKLMTAYLTFSALRERKIRLDQNVAAPPESEVPQGARYVFTARQKRLSR